MTDREELELRRLEVNVRRLIEQLEHQTRLVADLRAALQSEQQKSQDLEQELSEARYKAQLAQVASALGGGETGRDRAHSYLSNIISEIEYCIKQLEED